jgi:hypothetical protein
LGTWIWSFTQFLRMNINHISMTTSWLPKYSPL